MKKRQGARNGTQGRETKAIQLKFLEPESRTLDLIAILQGHETGF